MAVMEPMLVKGDHIISSIITISRAHILQQKVPINVFLQRMQMMEKTRMKRVYMVFFILKVII